MINIVIDEKGYDISDDMTEVSVHLDPNLGGIAYCKSGEISFLNVGEFIDAAMLIKDALVERYGGYK